MILSGAVYWALRGACPSLSGIGLSNPGLTSGIGFIGNKIKVGAGEDPSLSTLYGCLYLLPWPSILNSNLHRPAAYRYHADKSVRIACPAVCARTCFALFYLGALTVCIWFICHFNTFGNEDGAYWINCASVCRLLCSANYFWRMFWTVLHKLSLAQNVVSRTITFNLDTHSYTHINVYIVPHRMF